MATVVLIDTNAGSLDRFEFGGSSARKTHSCKLSDLLDAKDLVTSIRWFRAMPDKKFAIEPPPSPTSPPAGAGLARIMKVTVAVGARLAA